MEINTEEAIDDLTMILIYLLKFKDDMQFDDMEIYRSWKGYNFKVLDELDKKELISIGNKPSKSKSVYLTKEGIEKAKELLKKYNIGDWE